MSVQFTSSYRDSSSRKLWHLWRRRMLSNAVCDLISYCKHRPHLIPEITYWDQDSFFAIFFGATAPQWVRTSSFTRFLDHTQRLATFGRTSLDEWPVRRRDLYLTTHNTHKRQTSMPPVGFEPTISKGKGPQTKALNRAATGTGHFRHYVYHIVTEAIRPFGLIRTVSSRLSPLAGLLKLYFNLRN